MYLITELLIKEKLLGTSFSQIVMIAIRIFPNCRTNIVLKAKATFVVAEKCTANFDDFQNIVSLLTKLSKLVHVALNSVNHT